MNINFPLTNLGNPLFHCMKSIPLILSLNRIVVLLGIIGLVSCEGTKVQKETAITTTAQPLPDSKSPPTPAYDSIQPVTNPDSVNLVIPVKATEKKSVKKAKLSYDDYKIEIKTIREEGLGWGYDIYLDGALHMHQPHIPAVNGNQGFRDEAAAQKTAELIVWKMKHHISPPSISTQEMDSLGIL
jgi:hypothetical protein